MNKYIVRGHSQSLTPLEVVRDIPADSIFFSVLHCWKGYHQRPLDEKSVELTTFLCPFGLGCWQFLWAPFGSSNISEFFEKKMTENLQGLENHHKVVDDNLIHTSDTISHAVPVRQFLNRSREKNFRLSAEKFQYMKPSEEFSVLVVSKDGFHVQDRVIEAIRDFSTPKNKTDVCFFQEVCESASPSRFSGQFRHGSVTGTSLEGCGV